MELFGTVEQQPGLADLPGEDVSSISPADTQTAADRYQELFVDVQMSRVFEDSKTFVDCVPLQHPEKILAAYRRECFSEDFDLPGFVQEHFGREEMPPDCFVSDPDRTMLEHIDHLWEVLTRRPKDHPTRSSLMPLPHDYVVPGGRFKELYYWDSYFTMLGLHDSVTPGCDHLLRAMADNFAYLIDTYGHVPNGNRNYYLSRSQPPVFALMVELFDDYGVRPAVDYLPQLRKEYAFWMDGARDLRPGEAHRRLVCMADGALLNRYWDDKEVPREESYAEDVLTARRSDRPFHSVYRDIRAGSESGWDFSSRWLDDPGDLSSIRTTAIIPVDLNALLCMLETEIARLSDVAGNGDVAKQFEERAAARRAAMDRYLWNGDRGAYFDFDWQCGHQRDNLTAATVVPLFVKSASQAQARRVSATLREHLLTEGGIATTIESGSDEQWDKPNGWAPLQWMAIKGLSNYGEGELANEITHRWLAIVSEMYERDSKLLEKYVLRHHADHASGGEYPLQDGFGWTNGIVARLLRDHPEDEAHQCRAGRPRGSRRA